VATDPNNYVKRTPFVIGTDRTVPADKALRASRRRNLVPAPPGRQKNCAMWKTREATHFDQRD
jgi:hypothetical protein